jgi:N-acetylmuramoyl-L-alanine amidase
MATIVVDPGHGGAGDAPGSSRNRVTGARGTQEKELTLDIGRRLADRLRARGHEVVLTRSSDVNPSASSRARKARDRAADVFLSIHFNGADDAREQGTEVLVPWHNHTASRRLAESVRGELVRELGHPDRGLHPGPWSVLEEELHHAHTARCISEVSFLSDPSEEARLGSPAYRDRIAGALARSVERAVAPARRLAPVQALAIDWGQIRSSIVKTADEEQGAWLDPSGGMLKESDPKVLELLTKYWRDGVGQSDAAAAASAAGSAADQEAYPWSAAFVSWVMRNAGVTSDMGFDFSSLHMTYVVGALRNREGQRKDRPFWLYGIDEIIPQPGDILCRNRKGNSFTYPSLKLQYWDNGNDSKAPAGASHSDVAIGYNDYGTSRKIELVGGNVSNTVGSTLAKVDEIGRLVDKGASGSNVYAVITLLEHRFPFTND